MTGAPFFLPVCSLDAQVKKKKKGRRLSLEREREPVGEERSAGLKLTFDTQEVQNAAWISFVSL